jgi:hypothetical protein
MTRRISRGEPERKGITSATPEDIAAHLQALRHLAKLANQVTCAAIEFELRMGLSVSAIEIAYQQVASTDLHRTKELLTLREAARKLGVSAEKLRKDDGQHYPKAHRGGRSYPLYKRADIDRWLARQ